MPPAGPPPRSYGQSHVQDVLKENVVHEFSYHAPVGDQAQRYERIRAACRDAALVIVEEAPLCCEQTQALTNLRAAMMWANAAVACHGNDGKDAQPQAQGPAATGPRP